MIRPSSMQLLEDLDWWKHIQPMAEKVTQNCFPSSHQVREKRMEMYLQWYLMNQAWMRHTCLLLTFYWLDLVTQSQLNMKETGKCSSSVIMKKIGLQISFLGQLAVSATVCPSGHHSHVHFSSLTQNTFSKILKRDNPLNASS